MSVRRRQQLIGVGLGLVGLHALVIGRGSHTPLGPLAITIGACLAWAIGNVMSRRAQLKSGLGLTIWSAIVVPIPALALAFAINGSHEIGHAVSHIGWLTIFSTLYTVIGASLFGYGTWNSLLSRYPVGSVVPFTLLVPVAGITSAWIVFGQSPTVIELSGGSSCLPGSLLRRSREQPLAQPRVPPIRVRRPRRASHNRSTPDYHRRQLRPRDRGVEHLAPQEEAAGLLVRDDHRHRQLDPLAAVHRARVTQPQALGLLGRQPEELLRRCAEAGRPRRRPRPGISSSR